MSRILHVVTVVSPDLAFGGPLRVAIDLCAELRDRGHATLLAGGASGYPTDPPLSVEGVPTALVPVRPVMPGAGFSGLSSVRLLFRLARLIRAADVVHVHVSRDLVTMPAAALALASRTPLVLQCHGMLTRSDRRFAATYDAVLTRWVLRRASRVLVITEPERSQVEAIAGVALPRTEMVGNGITFTDPDVPRSRSTVLFAARLATRKRPEVFVEMAALVRASVPEATFTLVGPDEGCADSVRALIARRGLDDAVRWVGPLPHAKLLEEMARTAVYVLPAVDEPFGLTVAEAMSVGTPVVVTDTCGLAEHVRRADAGRVTGPAPAALAVAVVDLLNDPGDRGRKAAQAAQEMFGLAVVGDRIEAAYASALRGSAPEEYLGSSC